MLDNAQLLPRSAWCSYSSGRENISPIQPLAHSTATHLCEHLVDQFACDRSWHALSSGCKALLTLVFCGIFFPPQTYLAWEDLEQSDIGSDDNRKLHFG